jgi:hypothetical protein
VTENLENFWKLYKGIVARAGELFLSFGQRSSHSWSPSFHGDDRTGGFAMLPTTTRVLLRPCLDAPKN